MFYAIGRLLLCLVLFASAPVSDGWQSQKYGVAIDSFPAQWDVTRGEDQIQLRKEFNKDGYGYSYNETMTFSVSLGQVASLERAAEQLRRVGYLLQERSRVRVGESSVPLWIFFHQSNDQEVSWLALVLRAGLAYTFEVRGTPLDRDLLTDFESLIAAFRFLPNGRQEGWNALEARDPNRAYGLFKKLVQSEPADGNALYGLGLAELALGRSNEAFTHLELADKIIGLSEVQPALAQAYLQKGDSLRAVVTWFQTIQDSPDREEELQPLIADAVAQTRVSETSIEGTRKLVWEDFAFLGSVASISLQDQLQDARSGEYSDAGLRQLIDLDDRCKLLFGETLKHLMVEGGSEVEVHYLEAAFRIRQGISEAVAGLHKGDLMLLEEAQLQVGEGLELFLMAASSQENQR